MRSGTVDSTFLDIGDSSVTADAFAATILKEKERELLYANPALSRGESTETVTAGTNSVPLPTDAQGLEIIELRQLSPGGYFNNLVVLEAAPGDGYNRPGGWLDDYQMINSRFAYWSSDRTELLLEFNVPDDTDFVVVYQQGPAEYDADNLATEVSRIPDQHIDALYLRVAAEFATIMRSPWAQGLQGQALSAAENLSAALIGANWKYPRLRNEGSPGSTLDHIVQPSGRALLRPYSSARY